MATKKFTLLELHLGDGTVQIGPATLGGDESGDAESEDVADTDADSSSDTSCPGRTIGKLLLATVVLALLAVAVRLLLGGSEDDLDELEDLADLDAE